jgi:hypothetical protein
MQSLVLESYGTVEMDSTELVNVDGGLFPSFVQNFVYSEIKEAFKDVVQGYEYCKKKINQQ